MPTEHEELRQTVRLFLQRQSPEPEVRRLMDDRAGYDAPVWARMAEEIGLQGLAIPEDFGGSGFGYPELGIVFEELGRALLPSPFFTTVALAANALLESGDREAMLDYLPGIASGETIATVAFSEDSGGWDLDAVHARASRSGETWHLNGVKRYVLDAHVADVVLIAARTDAGISLFAVERDAPGMSIEVEASLDQTRKLARITLDQPAARLIGTEGDAGHGLRRTLRLGAVALAAEQLGGAERMLEMTVEYAKQRYQFGRQIGSFQAVKHKLADMLVEVELARCAVTDAIRSIADDTEEIELNASVAKATCSDAYFAVAAGALQLHGGIGFTWEHPAHLYFKRATSDRFLLGTPDFHRDLVGAALGI
ncbi:acyl-CoA dehydrogenase family protein [Amycolatopsis sp. GM8]|uniref:acyl-CoA dehydrogenase family protein n=1 Tax=Amycolatopsis sp. GM8 TaxID=2896530 RepID=UPI001F405C96|nr:acyl-CoA dehydrogenase family protein [Amycolatopsis sp. GM8]